jgi:hypothetical protein
MALKSNLGGAINLTKKLPAEGGGLSLLRQQVPKKNDTCCLSELWAAALFWLPASLTAA